MTHRTLKKWVAFEEGDELVRTHVIEQRRPCELLCIEVGYEVADRPRELFTRSDVGPG
ncbi:hypothetical protein AURDEDRAFT_112577 [Auricularia subglabra TFB-10046 SS5]|nr:hypothetical protein AURDEDRAFT_112577 [Auricularia subglabra TFB-10046 SS5]